MIRDILQEWREQCRALETFLEDAAMAHNEVDKETVRLKLRSAARHTKDIQTAIANAFEEYG